MNNTEDKWQEFLGRGYDSEPIPVPDSAQEWNRFSNIYFPKKDRRRFFLLSLPLLMGLSLLLFSKPFRIAQKLSATKNTIHSHAQKSIQLGQKSIHSAQNSTVYIPRTTVAANVPERVIPVLAAEKNIENALALQPEIAEENIDGYGENTSIQLTQLNGTGLDEQYVWTFQEPIIVFIQTVPHKSPSIPKPVSSARDRLTAALLNQFPARAGSHFLNPELNMLYHFRSPKFTWHTGLGFGSHRMGNYEYTSFYDYEDQSNRVWHRDSTQISFRSATYVQVPLGISFAILPSMDLGIELLGQLPVLTRATRRNYVFINDPGIPTSHNLANDPGTPVENRRLILPNIRSGINLQKHWRRASLGFGYRMDLISSISQIKFPESQANAVSSNNFRPLSNYYISFRFSL